MNIGIVGGGINGLCCAWHLVRQGYQVRLYERDKIMRATSCASSKLLHGGLRYLENGELRLVREALRERDAWIERAPHLAKSLRLILPIYKGGRRSRFAVGAGLFLYGHLAGSSQLAGTQWLTPEIFLKRDPGLNSDGLLGGYEFSDGQMDDLALGLWVAERARQSGAVIVEDTEVTHLDPNGAITTANGRTEQYDRTLNIAGPWASQLLDQSGIKSPYRLDLVRGSHLVLAQSCPQAFLLEMPGERRIFFVLPWKGQTLLGTTEVHQSHDEPIKCSASERDYLLAAYRHYWPNAQPQVMRAFAGLRPLLHSTGDSSKATREYAIHRLDKLIVVLGGKWTTAMALAKKVSAVLH